VRPLLAGLALLVFALRALVPVGFEPATDGSLSLVVCQEGFPPPLHPHGPTHQGGAPSQSDHCLFCSSPSTAPAPRLLALVSLLLLVLGAVALTAPAAQGFRLVHIPQARAPPALA
jgi:hypothetical protein